MSARPNDPTWAELMKAEGIEAADIDAHTAKALRKAAGEKASETVAAKRAAKKQKAKASKAPIRPQLMEWPDRIPFIGDMLDDLATWEKAAGSDLKWNPITIQNPTWKALEAAIFNNWLWLRSVVENKTFVRISPEDFYNRYYADGTPCFLGCDCDKCDGH